MNITADPENRYDKVLKAVTEYEEDTLTASDIADELNHRPQEIGVYLRHIDVRYLEDELEHVKSERKWVIKDREKLKSQIGNLEMNDKKSREKVLRDTRDYLEEQQQVEHQELATYISNQLDPSTPSHMPSQLNEAAKIIGQLEEKEEIKGNILDGYVYDG